MEFPGPDRFKYFAYFFMQGEIVPEVGQLTVSDRLPELICKPLFNTSPSILIKGSLATSKVTILLDVLRTNNIDSKEKLIAKW
jgi:hypothetical protein